jgi:hypothetical protein
MKTHVTNLKSVILVSTLAFVMIISTAASLFKADFSGEWALDQSKSNLGEFGAMMAPAKMSVKLEAAVLTVIRYNSSPMGESVTTDKITLDGKESPSTGGMQGSSRVTTSKLSEDQNTMTVTGVTKLSFDGNAFEITNTETWTISADGKTLTVDSNSTTPMGNNTIKQVYNKL